MCEHTDFSPGCRDCFKDGDPVKAFDLLKGEVDRYKEREAYFARVLRVADGGQYRADWDGAIENVLRDRDEAKATVEKHRTMLAWQCDILADERRARFATEARLADIERGAKAIEAESQTVGQLNRSIYSLREEVHQQRIRAQNAEAQVEKLTN